MTGALRRLSINRASIRQWTVRELVDACAARGVGGVGLWRDDVEDVDPAAVGARVRDAGLAVTSLCRGGFVTDPDPGERRRRHDDNRRALDEAAALGTDVLVLVAGGMDGNGTDLPGARVRVADAVAALVPDALARGVRLAVEPLHPMFCSDRCVISTLDQALDLVADCPVEAAGVVVDAYHVWWDPGLDAAIRRAGPRIAAFQVCDWVTPLPAGVLTGRGVMGDGAIDLRAMRRAVEFAGWTGPIEVEIFNDGWRERPGAELLDLMIERHLAHVIDPESPTQFDDERSEAAWTASTT
ncbi:xylose isomerase [Actinomycetospora sp. NBRC 106375]|uniref:sugar phosphate isomerase/epimerase family protein n=1 Tax=Actinomycetospora sp. NBRC 106375 TaxID=3032207 RepID=UPI0024A43CAB|nr:sugar phosphate isomerase/epimerase family protein [Actinomycetospora sp. NBRC 106375]GLZ46901.1 xylose isomerase [Actinomycetospora sp. NBRC 106375]